MKSLPGVQILNSIEAVMSHKVGIVAMPYGFLEEFASKQETEMLSNIMEQISYTYFVFISLILN